MSYADHGTVVPSGTWAILWSVEDGWGLLAPQMQEEEQVPDEALALTACLMRLEREPDFLQEQADWFKSHSD